MNNLFFYEYAYPKVIYGNFAKGLALAITKHETQHQDNRHNQTYIFQLYKWHGIEAIKYHLVVVERYFKKVWEKIINFI